MLAAWRSLILFSVCSVMVRPGNSARHLCTRAEDVRAKVPGGHILVHAIISAIDDYAERETGNREYFWNRPHSMCAYCRVEGTRRRTNRCQH